MFTGRELSSPVDAVRTEHAPETLVFDCDRDFETLPPAQAEELGIVVDSIEPASYPETFLPAEAPQLLRQYASESFTIGMPDDGSIVWTRQTSPPVVLVKPRIEGAPDSFVQFMLAEAFVEIGLELPEQFLGFFETEYRELSRAIPLGPAGTYQIGAALFDGWKGLSTREEFSTWQERHPVLGSAWQDAGNRLEQRVSDLPREIARSETDIADASELACAAIKHAIELPAPFDALETTAYRDHGPDYAVAWAAKTFDALEDV